jgi:hypothetical protein
MSAKRSAQIHLHRRILTLLRFPDSLYQQAWLNRLNVSKAFELMAGTVGLFVRNIKAMSDLRRPWSLSSGKQRAAWASSCVIRGSSFDLPLLVPAEIRLSLNGGVIAEL